MYEKIACEIDIRTLTSQQVLAQILDQIFDQVLDQGFWTRKYSILYTALIGQKIQCTALLGQKRLHTNYYSLFKA